MFVTLFLLCDLLILEIFKDSVCNCSSNKQENRRCKRWIQILHKQLVPLFWQEPGSSKSNALNKNDGTKAEPGKNKSAFVVVLLLTPLFLFRNKSRFFNWGPSNYGCPFSFSTSAALLFLFSFTASTSESLSLVGYSLSWIRIRSLFGSDSEATREEDDSPILDT